jgi:predicted outer membrane lipoprotein
MPKDPLNSANAPKVALGVSFIAFFGILINVLYLNHFNAKKRRYEGRKDCCLVINAGIISAFKAESPGETFACEMQVLYGLIDLKRTQESRSWYERFCEYWSPDATDPETEHDHDPAGTNSQATPRRGDAAEDHIRSVDIDACSMYSFCFEELRLSGVRLQCLPLVDYLSKYYDVHFDLPDHNDPDNMGGWKFHVQEADDDDYDYDEEGDTFIGEPRTPTRSHASSIVSMNTSRHPSPGKVNLSGASGGGGVGETTHIVPQLSGLKVGDTVNALFQEQQEERDRQIHTHRSTASGRPQKPKRGTHTKQNTPRSDVHIRFKRDKRTGSRANADINAEYNTEDNV